VKQERLEALKLACSVGGDNPGGIVNRAAQFVRFISEGEVPETLEVVSEVKRDKAGCCGKRARGRPRKTPVVTIG